MEKVDVVADGLLFPEGPVAMRDGSVLVAEIRGGRVTRVKPDGTLSVIADCGGGPNGMAIGPDGALYVCFGGEDLRTAYITLSGTGQLVSMRWPEPGLRLNCNA